MTYKVGPKGQVVIPKAIRDRVGIGPGDHVSFDEDHGAVRIRKAITDPAERRAILASLQGVLKGDGLDPIAGLEAEHRREVEADERERRMRGL
ncbi:MAG: AbrB/MazE/SpoVT family DNA-binding domain-containing protein [Solirubrobacterales bacterium]